MNPRIPPRSSPLLNAIYEALLAEPRADGIRISIEASGRPMTEDDGAVSMMKSLCWNLTSNGEYIGDGKAILALVHDEHTEATIQADLQVYFAEYHCVVDNDIWIDDDE